MGKTNGSVVNVRTVTIGIQGDSAYSQGRKVRAARAPQQDFQKHEEATWRERMHVNEDGHLVIPPMCMKNCLTEAAKFLSMKVPGKGNKTYGNIFESGIMCMHNSVVYDSNKKPIVAADVDGEWLFVPSDGKKGGGTRVDKCFPYIKQGWLAELELTVLNDMITPEIFETHLEAAGKFIGIGRFRPKNGGYYGRFTALKIKWN